MNCKLTISKFTDTTKLQMAKAEWPQPTPENQYQEKPYSKLYPVYPEHMTLFYNLVTCMNENGIEMSISDYHFTDDEQDPITVRVNSPHLSFFEHISFKVLNPPLLEDFQKADIEHSEIVWL